jgi:hypothetical protein
MEYVLHELLVLAIKERYPEMRHGVDFWVANPCTAQGVHTGDAFIAAWPDDTPPDVSPLLVRARELAPVRQAKLALEDRNQRLVESDWAMWPDVPTDKAAWSAYRQALRDLPTTDGWPLNFEWPAKPA